MFVVADAANVNGIPRVVLAGDAVVLEFEWLEDIVAALPADTTIEMSGDGVTTQTVTLSDAARTDGFVRVRFGGLSRGQSVTFTAKSGDQELVFASDHVASDLENDFVWLHALDELAADAPPASGSSPDATDTGTPLIQEDESQRTTSL